MMDSCNISLCIVCLLALFKTVFFMTKFGCFTLSVEAGFQAVQVTCIVTSEQQYDLYVQVDTQK